jgi:hypothetical protein
VFFLCRDCDHGDKYCDEDCAEAARRDSLRAAGRCYQRTPAGRAHHAARQQRYLDKREAAKMTHQSENRTLDLVENLPSAVDVISPAPVSTHDASTAERRGDDACVRYG